MADTESGLHEVSRDAALRNAVIEAALDCIIMIDQEGVVIEYNPAAEQVFGYSRNEAIGHSLAELVIPQNLRQLHQDGLAHYLATGENKVLNQRVEVPAINKAGDDLLVELAISPVKYGSSTFFSAYLRDITETRASQERLKASEERFQSLFELCPDAIIIFDAKGIVVDVNTRACELIGYSKNEVISQHSLKYISKDHIPEMVAATQTSKIGQFFQIQTEIIGRYGVVIPAEIVGRRIDGDKGPLTHMVVRDVSIRLENEKQLREAKEHAERANAAKSDFLANMSHEMRTPLNGIIGSLSLIDNQTIDAKSVSFLNSAEKSAETLLTLIDDLLDLSRIEAGELDLEESAFKPAELSNVILELFSQLADAKGLDLNVKASNSDATLFADVGKIRQVLINLVGNALKFTQRGAVNVEIDYISTGAYRELKFEVSDTGIGISRTDQANLFERFKQADSSRSKAHGGTGLGLSICKDLVEIMGGSISLSSAPGVGSTFGFSVPVSTASDRKELPENIIQDDGALAGRVLIAEDSETNARVAMAMLERLGLDYQHVEDGAAAVDAALHGEFDAVLMDVSMPIMDGLQATRVLRERGYLKPIIGLTAHAFQSDKEHALDCGMTGYVTKPLRVKKLKEALSEWLSDKAPAAEPSHTEAAPPLDADAIQETWEDDMPVFAEICHIFMDELSWRIPMLETAKDGEEIQRQAHSLKGGALNVGAIELSRLSNELQMVSTKGSQNRIAELIALIKPEAQRVKEALEQGYLGEASGE